MRGPPVPATVSVKVSNYCSSWNLGYDSAKLTGHVVSRQLAVTEKFYFYELVDLERGLWRVFVQYPATLNRPLQCTIGNILMHIFPSRTSA